MSVERLSAALSDRYRIERELGAGGMATVYLAADLKHDRKVAIKVLKPELAAVLGAERFVVEIKTTAALSHPHILPLFDSGTADGFLYYVMPYIQGETIRERLNRETQFGVEAAVRIACEVADALDYAHRNGVIHRDIKPENVLLHDGRAMVMDFGIALAVSAAAGGRMTETGLSLGTPHYMSPEQATAEKEITPRSDIYSLASVLYEMLAGQPPHTGGAAQQVIMKIITERAQDVTRLRNSVPRNVAAALAKALEKLAADRFESAGAFAAALKDSGFAFTAGGEGTFASQGARWNRTSITATAVAAVMTIALGVILSQSRPESAVDAPFVRFALSDDPLLRIETGLTRSFAISADGRAIVFRATRDSLGPRLWLRTLDDPTPRAIAGTEDGMNATFSPTGEWIAFVDGRTNTQIRKVRVDGGSVIQLASIGSRTAALTWGEDDFVYFERISPNAGIARVPAEGASPELVVPLDSVNGERLQRRPIHHHASGVIAYMSALGEASSSAVSLYRMRDGRRRRLDLPGIGPLGFVGDLLVYSHADGTLMAVRVDLDDLSTVGASVTIEPRIQSGLVGTAGGMSANGTLVFQASGEGENVSLALVDTSGRVRKLPGRFIVREQLRFSPDGGRVVVSGQQNQGVTDVLPDELRIIDLRTEVTTRLRVGGGARSPSWTADGLGIVTAGGADGKTTVLRTPLDGTAEQRIVEVPLVLQGVRSTSPDGRFLISGARLSPSIGGLVRIWTDGSGKVDTLPIPRRSTFEVVVPRISPDGQLVVFIDRPTSDVFVLSLADGGVIQVSEVPAGFRQPAVWGADSRRIYHMTSGGLVRIDLETRPLLRVVDRQTRAGFPSEMNYDLSPDGRTFVMPDPSAKSSSVEVALNWGAMVRRAWEAAQR